MLHLASTAACLLQLLFVTPYQTWSPLAECGSLAGGPLPTTPLESPESGLPGSDPSPMVCPGLPRDLDRGAAGISSLHLQTQRPGRARACQGGEPAPRNTGSEFQVSGVRNRPREQSQLRETHPPHGRQGDDGIQGSAFDVNPGINSPLLFLHSKSLGSSLQTKSRQML